jgi:hypothetical protein
MVGEFNTKRVQNLKKRWLSCNAAMEWRGKRTRREEDLCSTTRNACLANVSEFQSIQTFGVLCIFISYINLNKNLRYGFSLNLN